MNTQEQKRFDKLQDESEKEAGGYMLSNLTYPDFLLLLKEDKHLRKLIRTIAKGGKVEPLEDSLSPEVDEDAAEISKEDASTEAVAEPEASATSAHDPLRDTLAPELELLAQVRADAEIASDWLGEATEDEGRQLVRLIARAAQWESILDLWERLSARCKAKQGPALPSECAMLDGCLQIHNLIWRSRQACLTHAAIGSSYDHRQHQRGTPSGEIVAAEWLFGLSNAGGITQKNPLVGKR